jgi:hypothetical protein
MPTDGTMLQLVCKLEGLVHTFYMENVFSFPLFDDLHKRKVNYCGTVCCSSVPTMFGPEDEEM